MVSHPPDLAAWEHALTRLERRDTLTDPVTWVQHRLAEHVWSKQADVMRAVRDHRLVAVQSAHGVGKSHLASRLALWFLDVHPPRDTIVVTSAPTAHQISAVLWRYIRHGHETGHLPGYITQGQVPEWKIDGNLVGFGRRPADHQQSAFQGMHAAHLLVILDEAGGIPKWLWDSADSLMSGQEDQHLLAIGNPDDNSAHFARVCTTEPNWTRFRISAFDSPNYTGETTPPEIAKLLVGPAYVEDKRARWGENSPLWKVKVLGEFVDSEDGLIPLSWVRAANARWHTWHDAGAREVGGRRIIGVDVARYGEDATCLALREGDVIREIKTWHRMDTTQTTSLVEAELDFPQSIAVVDVIGVGAGVVDQLRARHRRVIAFNASQATKRRDATGSWRFPNCLSGDDRVVPVGELRRIYRAPYQGSMFDVEMASGDHFTATANHQVLTPRGWVSVQSLNVGDELCDTVSADAVPAGLARPEVDNVPPALGEVYRAAARLFGTERMAAATVNFHGDRPAGEVEVVTIDHDLLAVDPPIGEQVADVALIRLLVAQRRLPTERSLVSALRVGRRDGEDRPALPGDDVSGGLRDARFKRPSLGGQCVGLGTGPTDDTCHVEGPGDGSCVNGQVIGDCLDRLASRVPLHNGVRVEVDLPHQLDGLGGRSQTFTSRGQYASDHVGIDCVLSRESMDGHATAVIGDNRLGRKVDQPSSPRRLHLPSDGDTARFKNQLDSSAVGPEALAERYHGLAVEIATDYVVGIKLRTDTLHGEDSFVYTLETSSGTYATTNVLHKNCRAAAWWNLRELLDPALGATLALPEDDELTAELCAPRWDIGTGNTLRVESKDDIRKRIGRSTDRADAIAMAMWHNPTTGRIGRDDDGERIPPRRPRAVTYADAPVWT